MTRTEHLLIKLIEECAEVQQRATKALRFGLSETQPGQTLSNACRLADEVMDLMAAVEMLREQDYAFAAWLPWSPRPDRIDTIREKVETFLRYSEECGTLDIHHT